MKIKSAQSLVAEALKEIKPIDTDQAFKMVEKNNATIDSSKVAGTVFTIISEIATPPAME